MAFREVQIAYAHHVPRTFREPKSIDEAEDRRTALVLKINEINAELTARNGARDAAGVFVEDAHSFFEWRKRAVAAKRYAEAELMRVKSWMKQHNRAAYVSRGAEMGIDATDPVALLAAAHALIHRLACDEVELFPEEQALKDTIRDFLQSRTPDAKAATP
jgi:hypothetical protein